MDQLTLVTVTQTLGTPDTSITCFITPVFI